MESVGSTSVQLLLRSFLIGKCTAEDGVTATNKSLSNGSQFVKIANLCPLFITGLVIHQLITTKVTLRR